MSFTRTAADQVHVANEAFLQLAAATDHFERYDNPHAVRISILADAIARGFQMAVQDRQSLRDAALLHDLGEVVMDRDYIHRVGTLTNEERIDLTRHPVIGEQEVARVGADRAVHLLVRWHHEWWNGSGYPDALSREEIPLAARILRVVDSYAALTDERPFRPALSSEKARQEIVQAAGIEFDPRVVSVFLSLGPMPELESFATTDAAVQAGTKRDWNLFSSFMK